MTVSRRTALKILGAGLFVGQSSLASAAAAARIPFAFSLYGMKSLPLAQALKVCADIGYSGVELACMKDWPCDAAVLTPADRKRLRAQLEECALELPCLMENLGLAVPEAQHAANLDRLKLIGELAHDLTADGEPTPLVETVLGGKPEQWDDLKTRMVNALGDWERIARQTKTVIAIKAHVSGALHRPDDAVWLVRQIDSPWIKLVYDYSHFQRQGLPLKGTLTPMLPETVFVHIKDNLTTDGKTEFALPGDGATDYVEYLQLLRDGGYNGAVCVEVSAQVSGKPGYNPIIAAERCFLNLRPAFERAGLRARV
ncbi:MAG TPA: sugar phosphate isomerase/epimerase [Planctomycetaceae bacterium]|nr:sugar phosphate isomerase/epimerase [Planctomycetaceae bacterium]